MAEERTRKTDLDQQRAARAWKDVQENLTSDYVNLAKSAPALIMGNGLMQTLAFYESKGKKHHKDLSRHVCDWLAEKGFSINGQKGFPHVMEGLHGSASVDYRRATEEALALLRWIRQFASALSKSEA